MDPAALMRKDFIKFSFHPPQKENSLCTKLWNVDPRGAGAAAPKCLLNSTTISRVCYKFKYFFGPVQVIFFRPRAGGTLHEAYPGFFFKTLRSARVWVGYESCIPSEFPPPGLHFYTHCDTSFPIISVGIPKPPRLWDGVPLTNDNTVFCPFSCGALYFRSDG